ncbi:MAG: hypothetical protein FJ246_06480 [Nitrospira sp.]|nr:hypothetical protein [Nitrospira sp.]
MPSPFSQSCTTRSHCRLVSAAWLLSLPFALVGCVGAGSTLFGAGAGTATGSGVSYTIDNIAYKTFSASVDDVEKGMLKVLAKMEFPVASVHRSTGGINVLANSANAAHELDIEIDLERLSPQATRMRVVAKRGFFLRDSSTAAEILLQTGKSLEKGEKAGATARTDLPSGPTP